MHGALQVIDGAGVVHYGSDAILTAYSAVGLGWPMAVLRFPPILFLVNALYRFISQNRETISRWIPGGRALTEAMSCVDETCHAEEDGMDDLPDLPTMQIVG